MKGRLSARSVENTPGPGAYEPVSSINTKQGFSLKGRTSVPIDSTVPGPGAYATKSFIGEDKKFSLGAKPKESPVKST